MTDKGTLPLECLATPLRLNFHQILIVCSTPGGSAQSSDPLEVETELAEAEPEPTEEGKSNPSHALSSLAASFRKQLASN